MPIRKSEIIEINPELPTMQLVLFPPLKVKKIFNIKGYRYIRPMTDGSIQGSNDLNAAEWETLEAEDCELIKREQ